MNLRQRIEDRVRDLGHPHPEKLTPTELLDYLDAHKHTTQEATADDR